MSCNFCDNNILVYFFGQGGRSGSYIAGGYKLII